MNLELGGLNMICFMLSCCCIMSAVSHQAVQWPERRRVTEDVEKRGGGGGGREGFLLEGRARGGWWTGSQQGWAEIGHLNRTGGTQQVLVVVQVVGQYSQGVGNHFRSSLRQNSFDRLIFRVVKSDFERVLCSRFFKRKIYEGECNKWKEELVFAKTEKQRRICERNECVYIQMSPTRKLRWVR